MRHLDTESNCVRIGTDSFKPETYLGVTFGEHFSCVSHEPPCRPVGQQRQRRSACGWDGVKLWFCVSVSTQEYQRRLVLMKTYWIATPFDYVDGQENSKRASQYPSVHRAVGIGSGCGGKSEHPNSSYYMVAT